MGFQSSHVSPCLSHISRFCALFCSPGPAGSRQIWKLMKLERNSKALETAYTAETLGHRGNRTLRGTGSAASAATARGRARARWGARSAGTATAAAASAAAAAGAKAQGDVFLGPHGFVDATIEVAELHLGL